MEKTEKKSEIKVKVTFTPGYEKRFTEACLAVLRRREMKADDK